MGKLYIKSKKLGVLNKPHPLTAYLSLFIIQKLSK